MDSIKVETIQGGEVARLTFTDNDGFVAVHMLNREQQEQLTRQLIIAMHRQPYQQNSYTAVIHNGIMHTIDPVDPQEIADRKALEAAEDKYLAGLKA